MRNKVDALRFYGGDTRERCSNGNLSKKSLDVMYGDEKAYQTLNALLFEGSANEKERIWAEKNKLNPEFIRRIDETVQIYMDIFCMMKEMRKNHVEAVTLKRVDRASSIRYYEAGFTQSFLSCSKSGYDCEFSKKNDIVLLEIELASDIPFIDYECALNRNEYMNANEREILLPPFLNIEINRTEFKPVETRIVKDKNGKPPLGKYKLKPIEFPDYRKSILGSIQDIWEKIIDGKEVAACLLEKMNDNDRKQDYSNYAKWKETLHTYLKLQFSDIWYGGKAD